LSNANQFSPPFPKVLRLEPASSCNFHCIHCPTGLNLNSSLGIMSEQTFSQIYEQIKKFRFRMIVLYHGGEPFLNKNFFKMVKKLKPITEKIKTVTNGSLITDSLIDQILESELDIIEISLDGSSPEENNFIRVGSDYEQITSQIKKLTKIRNQKNLKKPEIFISNAQIPKNIKQTDEIKVPSNLIETFDEIKDDIKFREVYTFTWPGMSNKMDSIKPERNSCDHIINTFTIRWNGDVVPCCYDLVNMMVMGNVLKETIEDIWSNSKFVKLRKDINEFNPPNLCKNCNVLYPTRTTSNTYLG